MPQETEAILPQRTTAPAPKPYEFESDGLMRVTKSRMKVVARSREGRIAHSCLGEVSESMAPTIYQNVVQNQEIRTSKVTRHSRYSGGSYAVKCCSIG